MSFQLYKSLTLDDGSTVAELELDFDAISLADLKTAGRVKSFFTAETPGALSSSSLSPRLDEGLRIGIAWVAAMKSNRKLTVNDALKLSVKDALLLSEEALPFLMD